jgi:hypothetical protein
MDNDCIRSLTEIGLKRLVEETMVAEETHHRLSIEAERLLVRLREEDQRRKDFAAFKMDKRTCTT